MLAVALAGTAATCGPGDAPRVGPAPPVQPSPAVAPSRASSGDAAIEQAWYDRNFLEAYDRVGRRDARWDPRVRELIRNLAPGLLSGVAVGYAEQARARELVRAGCDDPLALFLAATALFAAEPDSREVSELFERAVAGMHEVAYPRGVARLAASALREDYVRRNEGGGLRDALDPVELRWLLESLEDGSYGADEDVVLVAHLIRGPGAALFGRHRVQVVAALNQDPDVDPWVRRLFEGERHAGDAWAARGSGYASEVTEEGWQGFRESLAAAREAYTASWELRPDRPEAAGEMVNVALTDPKPGETPRAWFDRGVAARLDYLPAYHYLLNSMRRRWGGSDAQLLAFARECAETRRFDTQVPFFAFRAVERIERDFLDEAELDDPPDWPEQRPFSPYHDEETYRLVATVLKGYRRDPASSLHWSRYASLEAAVAYKARRYDEALDQLRDVGGRLQDEAREAVGEPLLEARIEALASDVAGEIRRAGELYREGSTEEALELLRRARDAAPDGALPFIEHRLSIAELEASLVGGRPVDFLPARGLAAWSPQIGEWKVEDDGSLLGTSGARGLLIVCDARVGPDFEIEADIEVVSTSNGQFQAGIVFGEDIRFPSPTWSSFRVKKTGWEGEVVYFSQNLYRPAHPVERPVPLRNRVVIRSWDGRLWAWVNGDAVVEDYRPEWPRPLTEAGQVGFGSYLDDNVFRVRYRDVRLRRLESAPSP